MKATPVTGAAPVHQQQAATEAAADGLIYIEDATGRKIGIVNELDVLDEMRVLKVLGSENGKYLYFCTQLARVKKVGGEDISTPNSDREFQALAKRLGRAGVNRVVQHFMETELSALDEGNDDGANAEREAVKK